jgi:aspartyl/asparaginyl-tRNA synthetase
MARHALEHRAEDLARYSSSSYRARRAAPFVVERPFVRVPYTEVIEILKGSGRSSNSRSSMGRTCNQNTNGS